MVFVADVSGERRQDAGKEEASVTGLERLKSIRSDVPAVTHVDCSARIQSVDAENNPRFHRLLSRFKEKHGCPVMVNTSFNVRGEPMVCTPKDAYLCFMRTQMDYLLLGNYLLDKKELSKVSEIVEWDV
jgi:carbamoyltransferase